MKLLKENYETFVLLGICSPDKSINRWLKIFYGFISVFCLIILFIGFVSSSIYFIKYFSINLANAICVVYHIVASSVIIYSLILAHIKRGGIEKIFDHFQTFYDACK